MRDRRGRGSAILPGSPSRPAPEDARLSPFPAALLALALGVSAPADTLPESAPAPLLVPGRAGTADTARQDRAALAREQRSTSEARSAQSREQRNFALRQASHPWCLVLDSDETATPELVEGIASRRWEDAPTSLYYVMRTDWFMGRELDSGSRAVAAVSTLCDQWLLPAMPIRRAICPPREDGSKLHCCSGGLAGHGSRPRPSSALRQAVAVGPAT